MIVLFYNNRFYIAFLLFLEMPKVSAGNYDLNRWLFGGYETDIVTVIYGGPGAGKTTFCLLVAISQAKKGKRVLFIDTEGGFSVERVKQIVGDDYQKVLQNILLLKPTDFSEQKKAFEKLRNQIDGEIGVIIVDGLTVLYRLDFALARERGEEGIQNINTELIKQIKTLVEIARKKHIPVIVTNQVYNWEFSQKMVGGDILRYWAKCLIELIYDPIRKRRTAILRKHRSLPEKDMHFIIDNKGIKGIEE